MTRVLFHVELLVDDCRGECRSYPVHVFDIPHLTSWVGKELRWFSFLEKAFLSSSPTSNMRCIEVGPCRDAYVASAGRQGIGLGGENGCPNNNQPPISLCPPPYFPNHNPYFPLFLSISPLPDVFDRYCRVKRRFPLSRSPTTIVSWIPFIFRVYPPVVPFVSRGSSPLLGYYS